MTDYDRINKFLKDHGHEVKGGWEFLTPGKGVVVLMQTVIDIIEKIEKNHPEGGKTANG